MSDLTLSPIETLAQEIEDWGDGWRFFINPSDGGRRARLTLNHKGDEDRIRTDIEIIDNGTTHSVYVVTSVLTERFGWTNVSSSVRNPITRKALDHINAVLDGMEGGFPVSIPD